MGPIVPPAGRDGRFAEYRPGEPRLPAPDDLDLREARPADVPGIARLTHGRHGGDLAIHEEKLAGEFGPDDVRLFVAASGEGVLGFGRVRRHDGDPPHDAPAGWYLLGVIVDPAFRRRGIGAALTRRRLEWIAARSDEAYYFANETNRVSIDLHAAFGFVPLRRGVTFPGVTFQGGQGVLFRWTRTSTALDDPAPLVPRGLELRPRA